jgi:hypothetical protein
MELFETEHDMIENLPTDESELNSKELFIINSLFKNEETKAVFSEFKESLIISLLFVFVSLPFLETLIRRVIPISDRMAYLLIAIKAILLGFIFWLVKNSRLLFKN